MSSGKRGAEDPQPVGNNNKLKKLNEKSEDHPTRRLDLAMESSHDDMGSKTLFLGNLSFLIEEDDVRDFFKNVGEIADIRFAIKDDRFLGYGHIEFTTADAAQEALKLNKEVLLDRRVTLDISRRQRGAYTPGNSMDKSNQRGGHAQVKTVYVRGFEYSDDFDNIRSALEKHFEKCGEISRLCIPKDHVSGSPRGVAFIEFTDSHGFRQALGLDGSEVKGSRLTVEEAKKPREIGWCGSGGGYVRESGSSVSHFRESRSRGGWSGSHVRESGSHGGPSYYGGGQSGYGGGSYVRESGYGVGWSGSYGRESGSRGGYVSRLRTQSGYGSVSYTKTSSGGGWYRQSGYGRGGWGWESGNGYGSRGSGSTDGGFSSGNRRVGSGSRRGGRP